MKTGIELIAEERQRQINNGYDVNHDSQHDFRELAIAARTYIDLANLATKSKLEDLIKAGALIVAAIDRLCWSNSI